MSCWKETGEPSLEARTILVPEVTCPVLWPVDAGMLGVPGVPAEVVEAVVLETVAGVPGLCCSRRFCWAASLACFS